MRIGNGFLVGIVLSFIITMSPAQTLPQSDNMEYASTDPLSGQFSGDSYWDVSGLVGGDPILIAATGLTSTSYPGSGVGLSALFGANREGIYYFFSSTAITSGNLYYSFMIKVETASGTGSPIVTPTQNPNIAEGSGLLYVLDDGSGWKFGVRKRTGGAAAASYTSSSYTKTETQVIVVKYTFNTGSGTDDAVSLWVNPGLGGSEPTADVTFSDNSIGDITAGFKYLLFFEQATAASSTFYLDGVRVGTTWSDAPLPVQLTNFAATSGRFGVDLNWSTATEINNYGFDVERRSVGSDEAGWSTVGFVQGAGTSNETHEYYFADSNVEPGRYAYRIKQIDMSGAFTYYSAAEVEVGLGPKELALEPNYPNPFNPSTNITFTVPVDGRAALKVYNMLGQEVAILFDEEAVAGRVYQKTFDASSLPTGVYVSRLEFGGQSVMRKMLFVK